MKTIKIGYQHSFQVTQFLYDKIYFECEIEPKDTEEQVVQELINKCKEVARRVQDDASGFTRIEQMPEYLQIVENRQQFKSIINQEPQEKRIGVMVDDILSCGELKILETYRFIKDTNEELKKAYQQRYDELTTSKSITKH